MRRHRPDARARPVRGRSSIPDHPRDRAARANARVSSHASSRYGRPAGSRADRARSCRTSRRSPSSLIIVVDIGADLGTKKLEAIRAFASQFFRDPDDPVEDGDLRSRVSTRCSPPVRPRTRREDRRDGGARGTSASRAGRRSYDPLRSPPRGGERDEDRDGLLRDATGAAASWPRSSGPSLAARGHEVHFITSDVPVRHRTGICENIFFHRVEVDTYPVFAYTPYSLNLAAKILDVIKQPRARSSSMRTTRFRTPLPRISRRRCAGPCDIRTVTTLHGTDITLVGVKPSFYEITKFLDREERSRDRGVGLAAPEDLRELLDHEGDRGRARTSSTRIGSGPSRVEQGAERRSPREGRVRDHARVELPAGQEHRDGHRGVRAGARAVSP